MTTTEKPEDQVGEVPKGDAKSNALLNLLNVTGATGALGMIANARSAWKAFSDIKTLGQYFGNEPPPSEGSLPSLTERAQRLISQEGSLPVAEELAERAATKSVIAAGVVLTGYAVLKAGEYLHEHPDLAVGMTEGLTGPSTLAQLCNADQQAHQNFGETHLTPNNSPIHRLLKEGKSVRDVADTFGVHITMIYWFLDRA